MIMSRIINLIKCPGMETKIEMSQKEIKQSHVLRNYLEGRVGRKETAEALKLSERQVSRKARGMREEGESSLKHKNTGRKPKHTLSEEVKGGILSLWRDEMYSGCNISHFRELLEKKGLHVSYSALYHLLTSVGESSPKKHWRPVKKHRRRKRRAQMGELVQMDASPHEWLGGATKYALHGAIDDASGQLTGLYMTENECLNGYFEAMRQTVLDFGAPLSAYVDMHTIFRSPKATEKEAVGEEARSTQFGRAMSELGANLIFARSPQAKGRVERLWGTLQSRLPVEFRLRGITTVEAANKFLQREYTDEFRDRFAVEAEGSMFVPYIHPEDIDDILCIKEQRKTDNAGGFSYKGQTFKILDEGYPLVPAKAPITVLTSMHKGLNVQYGGRSFKVAVYEKPKNSAAKRTKPAVEPTQVEPHLRHSTEEWKKIWHMESYAQSLSFLYDLFLRNESLFL
jgi:transposase